MEDAFSCTLCIEKRRNAAAQGQKPAGYLGTGLRQGDFTPEQREGLKKARAAERAAKRKAEIAAEAARRLEEAKRRREESERRLEELETERAKLEEARRREEERTRETARRQEREAARQALSAGALRFSYTYRPAGGGERRAGDLFADSRDEAYRKLNRLGIRPIRVAPFGELAAGAVPAGRDFMEQKRRGASRTA